MREFFVLQRTLCFPLSELEEHQVSGEEGTKDMATGSRLSTSACQLCICLHLTPAKSPSGSLPHSSLHITSFHPPLPKVFLPTVEETLQPLLRGATATALGLSPQSRARHQVGLGLATTNCENWLDSKVIKVIKANLGY